MHVLEAGRLRGLEEKSMTSRKPARRLPDALRQALREILTEDEYDELVAPWAEDWTKAPEWERQMLSTWERIFGDKPDEKKRRP